MPSSRKRTRRNRRSCGGAGAPLNEAFADAGAGAAAKPAPPAQPPAGGANGAPQKGGRRKSRKLSKGAKAWTTAVTKLYREMKAKDKSAKFSDALKRASKLKKSGQL